MYGTSVDFGESKLSLGVNLILEIDVQGFRQINDLSMNYELNNTVFAFFAKNITEEDGFTVGYDVFAGAAWTYAMARKPRTWGISITQTF